MSSTIQTPSLFAEAAYGPDGVPGLGGVTGGGEVNQMAWQTAMKDAQSDLQSTVETGLDGSAVSPVDEPPVVEPSSPKMAMNTGEMKDQHPLSWDRLSMTVASMVAWNMQVSLADDTPTGLMSEEPTANSVQHSELLTGSGEFDQPDDGSMLINMVEPEGAQLTAKLDSNSKASPLMNSEARFSQSGLPSGVSLESRLDPSSSQSAAQMATPSSAPITEPDGYTGGAFHQTPIASKSAVDTVSMTSIEAPSNQTPTSSPTVNTDSLDESIRPTPAANMSSVSSDKTQSVSSDFVSQNTRDSGTPYPEIDAVIRVNKTSVSDGGLDAAAQRLQGVRAALAQLDAQAVVRAQVASVNSPSQVAETDAAPNLEVSQSPKPVKTALNSAKSVGSGDAPIKAHRARQNDVVSSVKPSNESQVESSSEPVRSPARVLDMKDATRIETLRSVGAVLTPGAADGVPPQTSAEMSAGYVGLENAEISADQDMMVETIVTDSENIEASEVPELPIQDPSQLDIDIDDQAGRVRVAMTKEGQEVSVRLETPQEVLEEYREMESEMEEAMARKGLELSDFNASGHDGGDSDGDERGTLGSESTSKLNQRGVEPGVGEDALEESGSTARLVNRIV